MKIFGPVVTVTKEMIRICFLNAKIWFTCVLQHDPFRIPMCMFKLVHLKRRQQSRFSFFFFWSGSIIQYYCCTSTKTSLNNTVGLTSPLSIVIAHFYWVSEAISGLRPGLGYCNQMAAFMSSIQPMGASQQTRHWCQVTFPNGKHPFHLRHESPTW